MSQNSKNEKLTEILLNHNPEFNDGFSERVINKIKLVSTTNKKIENDFISAFRWVALSGVAAILLLLITVYFTDGMFTTDAVVGLLNYSPDEPLLAELNY